MSSEQIVFCSLEKSASCHNTLGKMTMLLFPILNHQAVKKGSLGSIRRKLVGHTRLTVNPSSLGGLRGPDGVTLKDFPEGGVQEVCPNSEPVLPQCNNSQKELWNRLRILPGPYSFLFQQWPSGGW